MVKTPLFKGSCTALVTPLNESGIDYDRLRKNIDFQYENGTAAIVICRSSMSGIGAYFGRMYPAILLLPARIRRLVPP